MSEDAQPASVAKPGANKGVKQGLPTLGLRQIEDSATKLWQVARSSETSKQLLAEQTGHSSTTSSSFKARLAVLRGMGILQVAGETVKLTQLGLDLVQDYDEQKRHAARVSAIKTLRAYRELVEAFDGNALPPKPALSSRLKYEYGKSDEFASQAAEAFIDSLTFAGMLDSLGIVRAKGVASAEVVAEPSVGEGSAEEEAAVAELEEVFEGLDGGGTAPEVAVVSKQPDVSMPWHQAPAGVRAPSFEITLDLSGFDADDVIRILQALGLANRD